MFIKKYSSLKSQLERARKVVGTKFEDMSPDDVQIRKCMRTSCGRDFVSKSKINRICDQCKRSMESISDSWDE